MSLFALGDAEALAAAAAYGTPSFVYRLDLLDRQFARLRAALPPRVRLAYAIKANPHPEIVARFASQGASFDAASLGELELLERLGVAGGRILFAGPGKTTEELAFALKLGARIEMDGSEDALRIERLLSQRPIAAREPVHVSLRVHPETGIAEPSQIIGGATPSPFGVDEEELPRFLAILPEHPHLELCGVQVFAASNERDVARLVANHRVALGIAENLQQGLGRDLDLVDLGGGLGLPYSSEEEELDVENLGENLAKLLEENAWFKGDLLLEPGRWLVGPAGVYLSRVIRTKESRGTSFAVLEGGINHLLRPLLTGQPFPAKALGLQGKLRPYTLSGPLCTSLDRLGSVELPELHPDDLLIFGQTGAYGFTEAMSFFLSHPLPRQICLDESSIRALR